MLVIGHSLIVSSLHGLYSTQAENTKNATDRIEDTLREILESLQIRDEGSIAATYAPSCVSNYPPPTSIPGSLPPIASLQLASSIGQTAKTPLAQHELIELE